MPDVDAIRWMASEHDLEFVDLDTYGVDPGAGGIIPAPLALQHHVVAIKRKFGTPVVATSDPEDLAAQESIRETIGRDFISVVASPDQIDRYLEQLFGTGESSTGSTGTDQASGVDLFAPTAEPSVQDDWFDDLSAGDVDLLEPISGLIKAEPVEDLVVEPEVEPEVEVGTQGAAPQNVAVEEIATEDDKVADAIVPLEEVHDQAEDALVELEEVRGDNDPTEVALVEPEEVRDDKTELEEAIRESSVAFDDVTVDEETIADQAPISDDASILEVVGLGDGSKGAEGDIDAPEPPDSAALAADLVAEAVAEYEAESIGPEGPAETSSFPPLAKFLVDDGRVSLEDMEAVFEEHQQTGESIARILTNKRLVTEADLMWGMAQELGLEFVDLDTYGIDYAEAGTIPEATARYHNVMVIGSEDDVPVVATSNPTDVFARDDLRTIIGRSFKMVVATRTQIVSYISQAFTGGDDAADMAVEASLGFDSSKDNKVDDIQAVTEEAPIVRYVNLLILQALNERASDIHVEPTDNDLRIRYRIDGVLHDVSTAPRTISAAVITRLKVMADLNVAEHRIPQDGRISLNVGSKEIDLRMATLPTIHGEKVVMRVLDKSSVVLGFPDLGFDDDLLTTYEGLYTKPYGTILVTGPTGSGKSTTLYTTLTALNAPDKNIITVEDPVELQLKGVNQVQLNPKAGLTFASALKSILRSDPDIVLVGEIRDRETAVISIEAALTGHMVLSTLHTNSAASSPMRLIEMGIQPFLVTSSVSGVLAQRLARRLCMHCKELHEPTEAEITAAGWTLDEVEEGGGLANLYRAVGCSACANTGYRGRKALAELMPMTDEIKRLIIEGGSVEDIHKLAVAQGMLTLRQSGIRKALEGETTLEEVLRVVA